jgi:hypothetical protein
MRYVFNDGGRAAAGYKGEAGDCVCRAISIAAELPYRGVYIALNQVAKTERQTKRGKRSSARNGVLKTTYRHYLELLGWSFTPTMAIGSGCQVHLRDGELPMGRLIVAVSRHLVAVIDGVIQDTDDPSRDGRRCVYGYYKKDC